MAGPDDRFARLHYGFGGRSATAAPSSGYRSSPNRRNALEGIFARPPRLVTATPLRRTSETSILPTRLQSTLETFSFSTRRPIMVHKPTVESYGKAAGTKAD
jgi:hypothetical protein